MVATSDNYVSARGRLEKRAALKNPDKETAWNG
jgi:hypothetical protein